MKITIITACFNSKEFIRTAMDSVLAQTWMDLDYVVVDGGSTDGTVKIIQEYEPKFNGRMHWISSPDKGFYDALNKGIQMSQGEVIGILNADDFYAHSSVIEHVATVFTGNSLSLDAVYADVRFVSPQNLNQTARYYSAKPWRPWMLRWGYMPPHPTFFCRKISFERLGNYKLDYQIAADFELIIRLLWKGSLKAQYLPEPIIVMRLGGLSTNGIKSTITLNREIVRANRENKIYTNLLMLCPKYIFKVFEFIKPRLKSLIGNR
jgi:glycosyltransferase involved in cell wall biosynthesis